MHRTPEDWSILSSHGRVLVLIAMGGDVRLRTIAEQVGVTQRHVSNIVDDLEEAGMIRRRKIGRRSEYTVDGSIPIGGPVRSDSPSGALVAVFAPPT